MRRNTVAVPNIMDPREWLAQHLADADAGFGALDAPGLCRGVDVGGGVRGV